MASGHSFLALFVFLNMMASGPGAKGRLIRVPICYLILIFLLTLETRVILDTSGRLDRFC